MTREELVTLHVLGIRREAFQIYISLHIVLIFLYLFSHYSYALRRPYRKVIENTIFFARIEGSGKIVYRGVNT